ncbi:MAG: hypothetical protein M1828_007220 [Chrysothrix sp. TS-e1954]|nr:MAG: hypothetical protein M1828_007220 [Chrysothrix sp. TS-e1954]
MDESPLTLQARPDTFQPKIVGLYEQLFESESLLEHAEGFWSEVFLLKPDQAKLRETLEALSPEALLQHQIPTQELFHRAAYQLRTGASPSDENALDTLTVFLECVLSKKYSSPNSDVITVLAGLEGVDTVFTEFVNALEITIKDGRTLDVRQKAVQTAVAAVAGAYHTGLVSFFIGKDFFPALMKLVHDADDYTRLFVVFAFLGLLVNYNKFEFQNPYQHRFEDFVNEPIIQKTVQGLGQIYESSRNRYIAVQDDQPEGWNLSNTMTYFGLGGLTTSTKTGTGAMTDEEAKTAFAGFPPTETSILLPTYDFSNANKVFCLNFIRLAPSTKTDPSTFTSFLSLSSYLFQHAYRSTRASLYACLSLLIVRIMAEDQVVVRSLCNGDSMTSARLCRQRQPLLPVVRGDRLAVCVIFDTLVDGINHNLRKRLDVTLYILLLTPLHRLLTHLIHTHTKLPHHFPALWRSLLSFLRFLTSYATSLSTLPGIHSLTDLTAQILALALTAGEAFLPDARAHDDLFYKVFEAGDALAGFRDAYKLGERPGARASVEVLLGVSRHYSKLLEEDGSGKGAGGGAGARKSLSPREVSRVIRKGYETLELRTGEGLDRWERYREADWRNLIKRVARVVVADVRTMLAERS